MTLTNTQLLLAEATDLLTRDEEQNIFRLLAGAKADVETLTCIRGRSLNENSQLWAAKQRVKKVKAQIVTANLPLVIRVAKRFACPGIGEELLVSEGLLKLLQCIGTFNAELGYKLSTYLQTSLYRHFYRYIQKESKRNKGRVNSEIPFKTQIAADRPQGVSEVVEVLGANLAGLDALEKTIITRHYGIDGAEPQTLKQLSAYFGFSPGRLKRAMASAIEKLGNVLIGRAQR